MRAGAPVSLEYTSRHGYFAAQSSIRDLYDALVEFITNSDDSYGKMSSREGVILIEVDRGWRGSIVKVKDRAQGLSLEEMQQKLRKVGDRTSSRGDRGFMARGAKDCAVLGKLTFESIKDDKYHKCEITPDLKFIPYQPSRSVRDSDRKTLGIPRGNGTVVTLETKDGVRVPQYDSLVSQLHQYYALRDICSKESSTKVLFRKLAKDAQSQALIYSPPAADKVVDEKYQIEGYPDATARLQLFRTSEPMDNSGDKRFRPAGILVKGERGVHELSFVTPEFEHDTYALRYYGKITCPFIDVLCESFDSGRERGTYDERNPSLLIDPARQAGLRRDHPFTAALFAVPTEKLRALIAKDREADQKRRREIVNETTQRQLHLLAKAASRFMKDQLEELGEVSTFGKIESESFHKVGAVIIPGCDRLAVGEEKTSTFRAKQLEGVSPDEVARVTADSDAIKILVTEFRLRPSRFNERILTGNFRVRAERLADCVGVQVQYDGLQKVEALVEVVETKDSDIEVPGGIAFERDLYRVKEGKKKTMVLRAQYPGVVGKESEVQIVSDSPDIVVVGPRCKLTPISGTNYAEGAVTVQGRRLQAKGTITASVNDRSATAQVKVIQERDEDGPAIKIEIVPDDFGAYRAKWDRPKQPNLLLISARHQSVSRYLGPSPEFDGQNLPMFKILLAEIVAENVARKILEERAAQTPEEFDGMEVDQFYAQHNKLMKEFTPIAHQVQLSDVDLKRVSNYLAEEDV